MYCSASNLTYAFLTPSLSPTPSSVCERPMWKPPKSPELKEAQHGNSVLRCASKSFLQNRNYYFRVSANSFQVCNEWVDVGKGEFGEMPSLLSRMVKRSVSSLLYCDIFDLEMAFDLWCHAVVILCSRAEIYPLKCNLAGITRLRKSIFTSFVHVCQKSCVILHCNLQCGITQSLLWLFCHICTSGWLYKQFPVKEDKKPCLSRKVTF